ncbi:MAG: GNAT family protein [Nocardioidaceae bacterium]
MGLRPIKMADAREWSRLRRQNASWLKPWEATLPPGSRGTPPTVRAMIRDLRRQARTGKALPFVVTLDDVPVGQVTVNGITWGSARWAQVGYWVESAHAGEGIIPTAVALAVDHCFFGLGLHRIEIAIRPENTASLRVVEKLGFRLEGAAPRYLHIDGGWRDHQLYALTREEVPQGVLGRWLRASAS